MASGGIAGKDTTPRAKSATDAELESFANSQPGRLRDGIC